MHGGSQRIYGVIQARAAAACTTALPTWHSGKQPLLLPLLFLHLQWLVSGGGQAESGYASFISWPPSRLVLSHVVCASSCYPVIVQASRVVEGWQQEELVVVGR
jgi:hypothetical protein